MSENLSTNYIGLTEMERGADRDGIWSSFELSANIQEQAAHHHEPFSLIRKRIVFLEVRTSPIMANYWESSPSGAVSLGSILWG